MAPRPTPFLLAPDQLNPRGAAASGSSEPQEPPAPAPRPPAEEELRHNRDLLAQILDLMPQAVAWKDRAGRYLGCNQSFARAFGAERPAQLIGKTDLDLPRPPEEAETVRADDQEVIAHNQPKLHSVETLLHPDGTRRWVDTSRVPLVDSAGHPDGLLVMLNDLEHGKEAWHHTEALLRATLDSIDDGLLVVSASGRVSHRNSRFLEIWSVPPALAANKDDSLLLAHVAPQLANPEQFTAGVEAIYRTDAKTHDTLHLKDGRIIERFSAPVCTPGAEYERMWRFRDVTARVQAEKALRDREARLQSIFRAAPTAIGVVANRVVQEVNDTTCCLTGYSREELIGKSTRVLHATDEDFAAASAMYGHLAEKPMSVMETRWQRKDGTMLDILLSGAPIVPDDLAQGVTFIGLDITERKRTEERFRQLVAEQRTVLDTVTTGIGLLKNRRHQWVNRSFAQMFGYSPEEIEGKDTSINYADPADYRRVGEEGYAALSVGRIYSTETRMKRRDGTIIWCEITGKAVDPSNLQAGSIWALLDITERKRTETALRESEIAFRSLFEASPTPIVLMADRVFLRVNPMMCQITGYSEAELLGQSARLLYPDDATFERVGAELYGSILRDGIGIVETRMRRKDGDPIDMLISVSFLDPAAPAKGIAATLLDITERKLAEESYRTIIQTAIDGFWTIDFHGRIQSVNDSICRILGYSREELLAHSIPDLEANEDRATVTTHLTRIARTGLDRFETRLRRKDTSIVDVEISINHLPGAESRFFVFIRDITERKQSEADIRRLNAELEQRVRDRTAELARRVTEVEQLNTELHASQQATDRIAANLQETNSRLLVANEELESFSYSVSHDLRAPLRNISGFIELLHKRTAGAVDTESERYFGIVATEAVRLGGLIDSLLAFSRIGRADLKVAPVALTELVEEVRREMGPDLAGRAIEWRIGALPTVRGDRALLHQVVANLVGNAVKFTRHRQPAVIELGTLPPDAANPGLATFYVRDNGAGFNPAYSDKLFRVFQRLHNTSEFEGTGIGLANVKRIVARHGGSIRAEGMVDAGATFHVSLPSV